MINYLNIIVKANLKNIVMNFPIKIENLEVNVLLKLANLVYIVNRNSIIVVANLNLANLTETKEVDSIIVNLNLENPVTKSTIVVVIENLKENFKRNI